MHDVYQLNLYFMIVIFFNCIAFLLNPMMIRKSKYEFHVFRYALSYNGTDRYLTLKLNNVLWYESDVLYLSDCNLTTPLVK